MSCASIRADLFQVPRRFGSCNYSCGLWINIFCPVLILTFIIHSLDWFVIILIILMETVYYYKDNGSVRFSHDNQTHKVTSSMPDTVIIKHHLTPLFYVMWTVLFSI